MGVKVLTSSMCQNFPFIQQLLYEWKHKFLKPLFINYTQGYTSILNKLLRVRRTTCLEQPTVIQLIKNLPVAMKPTVWNGYDESCQKIDRE
jgi:hypothetical protein